MSTARKQTATSGTHLTLDVTYSLASMRDGRLLQEGCDETALALLEGLGATLPDLFGTVDPNCLDRISARLGETRGAALGEIVLLSAGRVHVVQPLLGRAGIALLATSSATGSIGLLLSAVRERAKDLESESDP